MELRSFEDFEDDLELRAFDGIDDILEAREPAKEKPKVLMSGGARKHLDNLGLHGKDRQKAVKWHKGIVKKEMPKVGAASAQIKYISLFGVKEPFSTLSTPKPSVIESTSTSNNIENALPCSSTYQQRVWIDTVQPTNQKAITLIRFCARPWAWQEVAQSGHHRRS